MSTARLETVSPTDEPLENLLFDHPGADLILRSQDSSLFRIPRIYIDNSSPIIGELIRRTLDSYNDADAGASLRVVQLPESSEILHCLLTFILPVTPLLPSTPEEIMELLSVAQKYQMGTALTHIRASIAQQNSLPTSLEPALHGYALAQKAHPSQIPSWLDQYIESIGKNPNLFDSAELNITMARHLGDSNKERCRCASIPSQTIRDFWEALASVVHGSFEKAESALSLVREREDPQAEIDSAACPLNPSMYRRRSYNPIIRFCRLPRP
ncbi:hypothetical protein BJV77DRAFT_1069560 [Russula vinacea]|nr:hypothetical protein BJV77DRAFT_1069560 [Russula vinacea]